VSRLQASATAAASAAAAEEGRLRQHMAELEAGLYSSGVTLHTAQVRDYR
jgi:hypothetical protein